MKKIVSIIIACFVMAACVSFPADAKSPRSGKSKSSSSASITRTFSDGVPNITGHTYKGTMGSSYMNVRFGADGYAYFSGNKGMKSFTTFWAYQGDGVASAFIDGSEGLDFFISKDGKTLYVEADDGSIQEFKLVR